MSELGLKMMGKDPSGNAKAINTDANGNTNVKVIGHEVVNLTLSTNEMISGNAQALDFSSDINYTSLAGSWSQDKASSLFKSNSVGTNVAYFNEFGQKSDIDFEIDVQATTGTGTQYPYVAMVWRIIDMNNYYYFHPYSGSGPFVGEIRRYSGGTNTVLATVPPINPSTRNVFRVKMIGNNIKLYVNGVLSASVDDGTHKEGRLGVRSYLQTGAEGRVFSAKLYDLSGYVDADISLLSHWTLFFSCDKATEITLELSADGVTWFKLPESPLVFDSPGDKIVEMGYRARKVRLKSSNDALITSHIFGGI